MKHKLFLLLPVLVISACSSKVTQKDTGSPVILAAEERPRADHVEAIGRKYAVATQGLYATQAAHEILAEGGNLMDAAVATSFVLAVERPQSTGITGGGFMLYRQASTGKIFAIDFRERAPLKATAKMFIGKDGAPDKDLSESSILASGTPGLVAGLVEIHHRFGHLPLSRLVRPAAELAEKGFPVYHSLSIALADRAKFLLDDPGARAIFMREDGQILKEGDMLVQKDLARTLRIIGKEGRAGFYQGSVARKFLAFFHKKKGLITSKDFRDYKVKWREPLRGQFHGYDIVSMPPPSSGGVHVIQFLNFLNKDPLDYYGFLSTTSLHLAAASLQDAFADRSRYLGDPDFVKVPVQGLISQAYADQRRSEVSLDVARHLKEVKPGNPLPYESSETTHFSMIDEAGDMISSTQTINGWMGSALVVPGTGLVLNNEMDDFSAQEGSSNLFGAIGSEADAIAPLKTPLSSMSPTLVLKDNKPVLAVGAPGGTRIISCVAQTTLNYLEFKLPLFDSVASIRYHHQWQPDILQIDPPGPRPDVLLALEKMGYAVEIKPVGCNVMAVAQEGSDLHAVSDPRDRGTSDAQ